MSAVTNEAGRVCIDAETTETFLLVASKSGFSAHYGWHSLTLEREDTKELEVTLRPCEPLAGIVLDGESDLPISGARVRITAMDRGGATRPYRGVLDRVLLADEVTTNSRGEFVFQSPRDEFSEVRVFVQGEPVCSVPVGSPPGEHLVIRTYARGLVRGVILNEEGEPLEGALAMGGSRGREPTITARIVEADAEGRFALEDAPIGPMFIHVNGPGYAAQRRYITVSDKPGPPLEFRLAPECEVKGVVVDDLGSPVEGAEVWVSSDTIESVIGQMQSQADGSWYMSWVGEGHRIEVDASKDGYAMHQVSGVIAPQSSFVLTLRRRGSIVGTVVDDGGEPVPEFSVQYTPADASEPWENIARDADKWTPFSSPDGSFEVYEAWPDRLEVLVSAPGFVPTVVQDVIVPPGGKSEPVRVTLVRGEEIWGRVIDARGAPVANASIYLPGRNFSGQALPSATKTRTISTTDGAFRLDGLPETTFDLVIETQSHGTKLFPDLQPDEFPRDFALEHPGQISGRIDVPWPRPDTACRIQASIPGTRIQTLVHPDINGSFLIPAMAPGTYTVNLIDEWGTLDHDDASALTRIVHVTPGATANVDFSTRGHGSIIVRAIPEKRRGHWYDFNARLSIASGDGNLELVALEQIGDNGELAFRGLPHGNYLVEILSSFRGDMLQLSKDAALSSDQAEVEVEFSIPTASLEGTVLSFDDEPADASISLIDVQSGRTLVQTRASRDGTYRFFDIQSKKSLIWISGSGFADDYYDTLTFPIREGAEPLEHWLEPEARLSVEVVDDIGASIPLANVRASFEDRPSILPPLQGETDPIGRISFTRLASGRTVIRASKSGYVSSGDQQETLVADSTTTAQLRLTRLGSLLVRITDAETSTPVEDVLVRLESISALAEEHSKTQSTDADGTTTFTELSPGSYLIHAPDSKYAEVEILPGQQVSAQLSISPVNASES